MGLTVCHILPDNLFDDSFVRQVSQNHLDFLSLAASSALAVVILFWSLDYDPNRDTLNYSILMVHGGTLICLLIDGFLINRVPVRLKHFSLALIMAIAFLIWSIIQSLVPVNSPNNTEFPYTMYNVLNWRDDPGEAIGYAIATVLVLLPLFIGMWNFSQDMKM
jgi:uncharacterized membrane protein